MLRALLALAVATWRAFDAAVTDLMRQLDEWVERQQ